MIKMLIVAYSGKVVEIYGREEILSWDKGLSLGIPYLATFKIGLVVKKLLN